MIAAQPELNVPISAVDARVLGVGVRVLAALARIPLRRLGGRVVAGLEADVDVPGLPAGVTSRTCRIAAVICSDCVRDDPCSGRSVAMRTSGSPSPSYSMSVHDADGSGLTGSELTAVAIARAVSPAPPSSSSPPQPAAAKAKAPISSTSNAKIVLRFTTPPLRPIPFRRCTRRAPFEGARDYEPGFSALATPCRYDDPSWSAPKWRNWKTRWTQNPVGLRPVRVRFPPSASVVTTSSPRSQSVHRSGWVRPKRRAGAAEVRE